MNKSCCGSGFTSSRSRYGTRLTVATTINVFKTKAFKKKIKKIVKLAVEN
jgi:hypothetical protein